MDQPVTALVTAGREKALASAIGEVRDSLHMLAQRAHQLRVSCEEDRADLAAAEPLPCPPRPLLELFTDAIGDLRVVESRAQLLSADLSATLARADARAVSARRAVRSGPGTLAARRARLNVGRPR